MGCKGTNTSETVKTTIEPDVTSDESVGTLHCSRKEFNPYHIDVSKLPNEVYDYSKSAALQDYTKDYVRLDYIMPNGLKVYTVGDGLVGHVLLVYKDNIHYSFDEEKHAEIFESKSGKNVITYSTVEGNYDPDVLKTFTPALDNYVNFLIADKTMDAFEYDYSCDAKEPNITEYILQTGEMGVRVGIDFAMANSYGEAVFKISYTENGFAFDNIEFINLKDTLEY